MRDGGEDRGTRDGLTSRLRLAWLALAWERLWPALWPPLGVLGLFLGVALLDVLPLLGPWVHAALLLTFAGLFGLACVYGFQSWRLPGRDEALRRIERDSGLSHRPLGSLDDRLAEGQDDPLLRALWAAHRRRLAALLGRLTVAPPSPGLPARDPLGLRAGVVLVLAVGLAVGGWDLSGRLQRAVTPGIGGLGAGPAALQVWLTPPAYTKAAPVLLEAPAAEAAVPPFTVPAGTKALALLQGGFGQGRLRVDAAAIPFDRLGEGGQRVEATLTVGRRIAVEQGGRTVAEWPVAVVQDKAPTIALTAPPEAAERGRLRLDYEAADDYGLARIWGKIVRRGGGDESITLDLPLPGGRQPQGKAGSWQDLTAHPWAGLPVTIQLGADDEIGQTGLSDAVDTTLPERVFNHPVARAVIEQRKRLSEDPSAREAVAAALDEISLRPSAFGDDLIAFLAMRTARYRLTRGAGGEALASVQDMLWNTALRIEEGGVAAAEKTLDQARRELEKALSENASQAEIQHLLDQLEQAMAEYFQAMLDQMDRLGVPPMPLGPDADVLSSDELQNMLDRLRDMAETGSRESAQQMLSELSRMLDSLRAGPPSPQSAEEMRQMREAMDKLNQIARRQRELLDKTFQQSQKPSGQPGENGQGAQSQEELRRDLGELMQGLGESMGDIPQSLGNADSAMRDAVGELQRGEAGAAAESQAEALQQLQNGAGEAMERMAQRMGQGGIGVRANGMQGRGTDPLGRPLDGRAIDRNDVRIPDQGDVQKARRILDELRRRSGDQQRPAQEKDYLRRLLQQF